MRSEGLEGWGGRSNNEASMTAGAFCAAPAGGQTVQGGRTGPWRLSCECAVGGWGRGL